MKRLAHLPVKASDFASACLTATVPRQYVRLVLVRVVATNVDGTLAAARCRSVALLFDTRHSLDRLCAAARDAIRTSRGARNETNALIDATHLFVRVTGASIAITASPRTVYEESVIGQLRGSIQSTSSVSGALVAYTRHCTVKSRVCLHHVLPVLSAAATAEDDLAASYVEGMRRLSAGMTCTTHEATCACFMERAMRRAGRSWMIVYALMPPVRTSDLVRTSPTSPAALATTAFAWLDRLMDVTLSESDDTANPLGAIVPSAWSHDMLSGIEYADDGDDDDAMSTGVFIQLLRGAVASADADDSADDSLETSEATTLAVPRIVRPRATEAAVVWAFARSSGIRAQLGAFAKHLTLYYKTSLEHVLNTSRRRALLVFALRIAAAAPADATLLSAVSACNTAVDALHAAMPLFAATSSVWQLVGTASSAARRHAELPMHSCETTGYALIVMYALLTWCDARHASRAPRVVNPWSLYTYCPRIVVADQRHCST